MGFFGWIRFGLTIAITIGVLFVALLALVDALRRPADAFAENGKKTKKFWLLILGAGALFAVMGAVGMLNIMINILAIVPGAVYWYDVRPAIRHETSTNQRATGATFRVPKQARRRRPAAVGAAIDTRPAGKASDPRFD